MIQQQDIVEVVVAILRRNRDTINNVRPCQVVIHLPPVEDRNGKPHIELGKIKLRGEE